MTKTNPSGPSVSLRLAFSRVPVSSPEPGDLLLLPALGFLSPKHFSGSLTMTEMSVCWSHHAHHQHAGVEPDRGLGGCMNE